MKIAQKSRWIYLVVGCLFLGTLSAQAQIVNVESLRRVSDTSRWSGNASLSFNLIKNKNTLFNLRNTLQVQYLYKQHLVLFINEINFKEVNAKNLVDKGIQHFRYNYRFSKSFAWEGFVQSQFDEISAIDFRGLIGTGPRFKVSKSETYNFFLGTALMFEYEKIENALENVRNRDFRNSSYLSFSLFPKENISIVSTTYIQPRLNKWSDFRISNDSKVVIGIVKNLGLSIGVKYLYDAFPAIGIPKEQYRITNGLTYSFD